MQVDVLHSKQTITLRHSCRVSNGICARTCGCFLENGKISVTILLTSAHFQGLKSTQFEFFSKMTK